MLPNWSSEEPNNRQPKKFDPFDVVFCCHCDRLHHVDSHSYLQVVGDMYQGLQIDMLEDSDDEDVRSYISYLSTDWQGDRLVSVFCFGNNDETGCLEKYLKDKRTTSD